MKRLTTALVVFTLVSIASSTAWAQPRVQVTLGLGGGGCHNHGYVQPVANYGPPPGHYYCNDHRRYCNHAPVRYGNYRAVRPVYVNNCRPRVQRRDYGRHRGYRNVNRGRGHRGNRGCR